MDVAFYGGVASVLILVECGSCVERLEVVLERASDRFDLVGLDHKACQEAVSLRNKFGLKPADAIHIATALKHECRTFYTFDEKLLALDGKLGALAVKSPMGITFLQGKLSGI